MNILTTKILPFPAAIVSLNSIFFHCVPSLTSLFHVLWVRYPAPACLNQVNLHLTPLVKNSTKGFEIL